MKVLVVNNAVPFVRGGAEALAEHLVIQLNNTRGVEAELLRIPFSWLPPERLIEEIVLNRALRIYNVDRVIGLKFPAYLIPHDHKILWILHQFRQAYDLFESRQSHLHDDESGKQLIQIVRTADQHCFSSCRAIYTNSPITQHRLKQFNNVDGDVLYPPLYDEECFQPDGYAPYIFAGGRVGSGKRQALLVKAMKHSQSDIRLIIAGPAENKQIEQELTALVSRLGLSDRVDLRFGYFPRHEIAELVNKSLVCAYIPIDEDSLGYVTMEAFAAAKAVVTCRDSGGLLEIVVDGSTGFVVDPAPESLGHAFDQAILAPAKTIAMGRAAQALLHGRTLTWKSTIDRLLS
jgi:glycosyltransferase involved in cell wall biosynthesis